MTPPDPEPIAEHRLAWTTMAALSAAERVETWNRAYEGYFMPAHFDDAALETMRRVGDLVAERSPVLLLDGEIAGFAAHGQRGDRAWLGGFGVAAPHRRRGLGTRVLHAWYDVVRGAGVSHAQLEVLEPNEAARALYSANGFRPVRWLEVWTVASADPAWNAAGVERVGTSEALDALARLPGPDEPWQRATACVRGFHDEIVGLRVGLAGHPSGAAAIRPGPGRVSVLQLRAAPGPMQATTIGALLASAFGAAGGGPLRWINVPEDDPASAVLRTGGRVPEIRQVEMARDFTADAAG